MDLSVIENDPKEVKKYLQNFVPINYYRVLDDAYLYQVRAILLHSVSHADSYNPIYAGLINDLTVTVGNNHASYKTDIKAVVDNVSSLITKTEKLEAETSTSIASIESIQEVYAADKEARATEVKTLTAAIKDIVIGGRNIMINSDFSRGYREWQEASIEPLEHFIGKLYKVRSTGIVGSLMGIYPLEEFQNMAMVEGTQYSVSFYAYGSIMLMDEIYLTSATEAPIKLPSVVISTDLSERRHITFKAPTGGGGLGLIIGATATKEDDWFSIGKVKVELGNRPTDWTPAPEDVDGYIARVQSVITEFKDVQVKDNEAKAKLIEKLDSRVDDNAATVKKELETQVSAHNALAKRTETVEASTKGNKAKIEEVDIAFTDEKTATAKRLRTLEAASALGEGKIVNLEKVTADTDKIVSEQGTTLNAKIDNISSGGRNLLKNADFKLGVDTWGTSKITDEKNILGKLLTVTNTGTTTDYFGLQPVNIFRNIRLLEDKEYVLSFYAKGNIPIINDIWITSTGNLPQQLSNAEITTGISDRTEIVFTAENTSEESSLLIGANGYAKGSWFAVVAVKLELGNKATDWTIAPEDTGEIIEQVEANIEAYKKAQAEINKATAENYTLMETSVGENKGELERLDSLVTTNTSSIGTIKNTLEVDVGGNIAKIIEDYKAVSSEVGAMGTKLDGVYAQTNPVMMGSEEVMIGSEQHYAGVWTETGARIEQGLAQSFRIDVLESSIATNRSLIKEEAVTRVNALGSLSALTTNIKANTDSNTAEIEKLMITVTTPESGLAAVVTELKAVVAENTTVGDATKKAAEEAAKLAGNKGEVIFSNVAPGKDKEAPQNLWIDTSEDLNTPKRWAGGEWLVVTDFAATAAQRAANKAQQAADDAIRDAGIADGKAVEAQRVADLAFEELLDISSDSKITPSEKEQLKLIVNSIEREHVDILARASKYDVSTTEYVKTYTALSTYVATLLVSMSTTSEVDRDDFNTKFDVLFLQRANLNSQIINAIKQVTDDANKRLDLTDKAVEEVQKAAEAAQETATKATESITEASIDSKLTPVEKKQIKIIWSEIVRENSDVIANAAKYSVSTTDYDSAYELLRDYLTPLLAKTTESSDISRTEFNSNFDTLFLRRASLNTLIVNAAKAVADEADRKGQAGVDAASEADRLAKAAQEVADKAAKEIEDAAEDDKLTAVEKKQVRIIWDDIKREHTNIIYRAEKYKVNTTDYGTAYENLSEYIDTLSLEKAVTNDIERSVFNSRFDTLFLRRASLNNTISETIKRKADEIDTSVNPLMIGSEELFIGDETVLIGVWSELSARIEEDILNNQKALDAQLAADLGIAKADEAAQRANVAQGLIDDISADNKVTPVEKKQLTLIWEDVKQTDIEIRDRALKYEVSTVLYNESFNDLASYIKPLLLNTETTSNIVRTVFDSKFSDMYSKRATLDINIVTAAKKVATDAQSTADSALREAGEKASAAQTAAEEAAVLLIEKELEAAKVISDAYADGVVSVEEGKRIKDVNAKLKLAQDDATKKANAAELAASNLAKEAERLAKDKGETIFSATEPSEDKQLTQNLWIDISGDLNTPKRWNGDDWVVVTDSVATQAASAASEAGSAASKAQAAADTANGNALTAQRDIEDITSDGKLTPIEKQQINLIITEIIQTHPDIRARAKKYEVATTDYDAAYSALMLVVDPLLLDLTKTSDVDRGAFNAAFTKLYEERGLLDTSIVNEAKKLSDSIEQSAKDKGEVIFSSTEPDESKRLIQNMWIDTTGGKNTPKRWVDPAWVIVTDKVATDAASIAAGTRSDIDNIAADNKFTPTEKRQLVTVLGEINQEDAAIRALAAKYEISAVDYAKAFKDLMDYIDPKMLDKSATDTIVRSVFNGHFNKLYGARATLELQINTKIETNIAEADRKGAAGIADAKVAKEAADTANGIVKDITDDNVLTPSEKEQVWQIVESIKSTHVSTTDYAVMYGVPTTTYSTKYDNLLSYINGLLSSMTTKSVIDRAAFNSYFTELYDERSKLDKVIRDKAKSITTALDNSLNPVMIGSESVFIGDETILLGVWSETSERIHEDFLNQVRAAEAKDAADKAQQDADSADLHASRATLAAIDAKERADKAQKEADVARDKLLDISEDSKLTASEKQQTKIIVSEIELNHTSNMDQASKYEVDSSTYYDMYEELMTYISPLLEVMTTTDDINRIEFDGKFNEIFTARANLHRDINAAARLAVKNAQDSADIANGNFEPAKLSKLVEGSGAFATELGAIAGQYTMMEGVIEGQKAAIETYNSIGNLEALKNEIAKERLNKNIEGLDAQKAKLTTAVADFTAQIELINTKIVETENEEVKADYRDQISKLQAAIVNANAEKSIIDDNKRQLTTEVRQLEDLELVKDKILLESGIKMTGPGGKVKGIGLLMEDTGYTNFDILVDNFTMSVDENAKSINPFRVNGEEFEVNVPLKANSTITTPSIQGGSITGTSININDKFTVSDQGDLVATSGTFGGIVTGGSINIADKFKVDSLGNMTATSGKFSGDITGASGTFSGLVSGGSININNRFKVSDTGEINIASSTTGSRLVITNELISVYDANNNLRVRLGLW